MRKVDKVAEGFFSALRRLMAQGLRSEPFSLLELSVRLCFVSMSRKEGIGSFVAWTSPPLVFYISIGLQILRFAFPFVSSFLRTINFET